MKSKIKKAWFYGSWLLKFSFLTTLFLIISLPLRFSKKYKDLWIIGERPEEARDNGYWLYKWILENKPETNVRFVLKKDSVDYAKMPRKDLIIEPGTAKHYIYWILSSYSVSTHMHGACPGKSFCIPFLPFARHKKTVFLQHGIIRNMIKLRGGLDVIIASAEEEKEIIAKANPRYKDKIFVTGLCRYDNLDDTSKTRDPKMILLMPTFRKQLRDIGRLKDPDEEFKKTDYYKAWNSLLNNEKLGKIIKEKNMQVIFFPHNEMQSLAHNLTTNNKNIIVGKPGEFDTQALMKEASIMVTDYSSVFYDFVYMDKPVLFYQFDQKDFFSKHYAGNGKDYPFGDIFVNEEGLVCELLNMIENGCTIKKQYHDDASSFYSFRDKENCQRNYDLIKGAK